MRLLTGLAAAALFVSTSTAALAATATPEEAQRLAGVFETYLGKTPGVVTVTPAGEAYVVKLDLAPLIAKAPAKDFTASLTPLEMGIAPQGGGKWQVTQDQAVSITIKVPDALDFSMTLGSFKSTGIYDEGLAAFASSTTDIAGVSLDETITPPGEGPAHVTYTIGGLHYQSSAESGASGGIDGTMTMEMKELFERFTIAGPKDSATPPMEFSMAAPLAWQDTAVKGLRAKPVLDLMAWFVAHPSREQIAADQGALKDLARAALPLFNNISAKASLDSLAVTTPMGPVGLAKSEFGMALNGVVAGGMFAENFTVSGLTLPPGLVPPWAADLVPGEVSLDFSMTGFDAAAPAALILDNLDLSKEPPLKPDLDVQLLQALLPNGTVTLSLGPSSVISKIINLGFEGSMTAGPAALPAGQATVTAKGIDQLMDVLKTAPAEMGLGQAIGGLIAAKGLSKPGADGGLVWVIEGTPTGSVTINGVDPSKM